jgi:hypothetical protein
MTTVVKIVFKKLLLALGFACFLLLILAVYYKNVVMNTDRTLILNGEPYITNIKSKHIVEINAGAEILVNVPLKKTSDKCITTIGFTMTNMDIFYAFSLGASSKMSGDFVANHLLQIPNFIPTGEYNINTFYKSECEGAPGIEITRVPPLKIMVKK